MKLSNVTAIVIAFSAAQQALVRKRTLAKMRSARESYPETPLILAAVDFADEPITTEDGHRLLQAAGYDLDDAQFIICATEEEFQSSLSSHLLFTVEVESMQALLDRARNTRISDREIE
ncbi:hypothetical protein AB0L70_38765 [Kribbella sp. NPDC051952]|uniref:hypothetical protein n=1 Tax=Kribbella sp. NPDC051952 TaxID=3154851 RepID=UPI0034290A0E